MTMGMGMMVAALIFFIGKCWRQPHTNQFCYSQLMVLTSSASSPPRCSSTANLPAVLCPSCLPTATQSTAISRSGASRGGRRLMGCCRRWWWPKVPLTQLLRFGIDPAPTALGSAQCCCSASVLCRFRLSPIRWSSQPTIRRANQVTHSELGSGRSPTS